MAWALDHLDQNWNQIVSEFEAKKAGQVISEPLFMIHHLALAGQENERTADLAAARRLILQAECNSITGVTSENGENHTLTASEH